MAEFDMVFDAGVNISDAEISKITKQLEDISTKFEKRLSDAVLKGKSIPAGLRGALSGIEQNIGIVEYANKLSKMPFTGAAMLGEYGMAQRVLGKLSNSILGASSLLSQKEGAVIPSIEGLRQRMLFLANENRAIARFAQHRDYWGGAVSNALKYGLSEVADTTELQKRLDYFGLKYKADSRVKNVDPRAYAGVEEWTDILGDIYEKENALRSGKLGYRERKDTIKELNSLQKKLITVGNKLGSDVSANSKEIAKNTRFLIGEYGGESALRGGGIGGLVSGLASNAFREITSAIANDLETRWGEHVTRNVYDSRRAQAQRTISWGSSIGGIIGSVVGAVGGGTIGLLAAGPGGAVAGATKGAMWGAGLLGAAGHQIGGLSGKYKKTMLESDIVSANQMAQRLRAQSLYGGDYNTFFAQQLTDAGITNGESAMGSLASRAMGMRGRMMLGQVGEEEMLYMSMMPNYYQALMNGVTGPELARAYDSDLDKIGDSSLRYVVGTSVAGQDAYMMANSKYFSRNYSSFVSAANQAERVAGGYESGFAMTQADVARRNIAKITTEFTNTAMRGDEDIINKKYGVVRPGYEENNTKKNVEDSINALTKGSTFVTVVNIDGEEVARAINKGSDINESNSNEMQSFYVGGF